MSDRDYGVGITGVPQVGQVSKKPCYLITLYDVADNGKLKDFRSFISTDKPDFLQNFIHVKGIYSKENEDEIGKRFLEIIASTPKESILDIMFPIHRVWSIKSLVFNANKPSTLVK
jgi:hypothetical protein